VLKFAYSHWRQWVYGKANLEKCKKQPETPVLLRPQAKSGGFFCYRLLKNMTTGSQWPDKGKKRNEPTSSRGSNAGASLFGLIAWPLAAILNRMPLGYEDEVGFHLGARSSRGERGIGTLAENHINPPQEQPQDDYPPSHRPE